MRNRSKVSSAKSNGSSDSEESKGKVIVIAWRSTFVVLALFVLAIHGIWAVYHYQFQSLPQPLTAEQVGKRGFSEEATMKHIEALTQLGPHPVGSDALDLGVKYVFEAAEEIKKTAHWEVDVEVDLFHASPGTNVLEGGLFKGKTLLYSDLTHVVLRILPKYASEAADSAILVSSHIDTVFSAEGAGDCSSCIAVMLELARGVSHWAHGFKHSVVFLFNVGEEEGLNGAHSFITQHPWSSTIRMAVDLEAMGNGGKSAIFEAGPNPLAIENYALVAKYPSAQIIAQDVFASGFIKSGTDFLVYKEVAGLSGLDFAYLDNTAVYHTKNDKLELLKPGSFQHLGENMLAFLLHTAASSSQLSKGKATAADEKTEYDRAIYFDILGTYMVVFRQSLANLLYNSVIMQALMIWGTSIVMGGSTAAISLALSFLSILLMWICSLSFSIAVAFILPLISSTPVPFIANPLIAIGLFASPALLGALTGQHIGYLILKIFISQVFSKKMENLSPLVQISWAKLEAERWIYKSGLLQWLILLVAGHYLKVGSTYIALLWLVSPAFAYGLLEATLSSTRAPKALKTITLLIGQFVPFLISAGMFIRLAGTISGMSVRFDSNPGANAEWLATVILAVYISAVICLTMVYLLSYVHISGAKYLIAIASFIVLGLSVIAVVSGLVPPFTDDFSRAVNVVHVVDASGSYEEPTSYVSLFSTTPGKLTKEVELIDEGFVCERENPVDFVTFTSSYICKTNDDSVNGWSRSDVPILKVESDSKTDDNRVTQVTIDTKVSTRWALGINTNEIEDFRFKDAESGEELIQIGEKVSVDGWHLIQYSGGRNAPKRFDLSLYWSKNQTEGGQKNDLLLKLRTDVNRLTPKVKRVLDKLPSWCSQYGKSTSPQTLSFLSSLHVDF